MILIPTNPVPSQSISISLGGQQCLITLRQLLNRQYLSLSVNGVDICDNALIQYNTAIVRMAYTGFVGDIYCIDYNGESPPNYTGWGTMWDLFYG